MALSHVSRFTLWLLSSDGLGGSRSGLGETVRGLLESRGEVKVAVSREPREVSGWKGRHQLW